MNFNPIPFNVLAGLVYWLVVAGTGLLMLTGVTFLTLVASRGTDGIRTFGRHVSGAFSDFFSLSPRRIGAIAKLTFLESYRRRALLVFVVFGILIMFAGWFLSGGDLVPYDQVKLYVSFVLRTISWLIIPVTLLLACWGIPEDIRVRSLHTVVTKPVRRLEVVLGRMIGFGLISTLILAVMGTAGYIWIQQQIGPEARSELTCRRPILGTLSFLDRAGNPALVGINVGDLSEYRSFIEGATKARAIWTFPNVDASDLTPEGDMLIENRIQAFRSHKGNMNRPLLYQLVFFNPEKNLRVGTQLRQVNEFRGQTDTIPRTLPKTGEAVGGQAETVEGETVDLIDDLVTKDGTLTVEVLCIDPGQYLGMARTDLFIRTPDGPFWAGYLKSMIGLEMMALLVVFLGVTASTFLKGPVATLLTFCLIIIGQPQAREFMMQMINGRLGGGGVFESMYRIVMHMNPTTELPAGPTFFFMQWADFGLNRFVWLMSQIIPNFDYFNMRQFLAEGFDIPFDSSVLPSIAVTLGFFLPCVLVGYLALRIRELEAK